MTISGYPQRALGSGRLRSMGIEFKKVHVQA